MGDKTEEKKESVALIKVNGVCMEEVKLEQGRTKKEKKGASKYRGLEKVF